MREKFSMCLRRVLRTSLAGVSRRVSVLLLACLAVSGLRAEEPITLIVQTLDAAEQQYAMQVIGHLEFTNEAMFLIAKDGTELGSTPLSELHKIYFDGSTTDMEETPVEALVQVDRASETLSVSCLQQPTVLRVYDMSGKLILQQQGTTVQVGSLPKGMYLLQFNTEVVKFIKQ